MLWLLFNKMVFNPEAAVLEAFPLCSWPSRPSRCPGDTMTSNDTMTSSAKKRKTVRAMASACSVFEIHLRQRPILNVSELHNHLISCVIESPRSIVRIIIPFPRTCTFVMAIHGDLKPTSQTETHLPQPPTDPGPALNQGNPIQRPR